MATSNNTYTDRFLLRAWGGIEWLVFILAAPYYLSRMRKSGKYRAGLRQRLSRYTTEETETLGSGGWVWVHAVSVGELQAARPLLKRIKDRYTDLKILVTTVTDTGQKLSKELEEVDYSIYLPLDLYPLCRKAVRLIQPRCVIIFETEIWPSFIRAVSDNGTPLFLVNARISDKSYRRYYMTRSFFKPLLQRFKAILAQSETDAERFLSIGVEGQNLQTCGNIKFEAAQPQDDSDTRQHWRSLLQLPEETLLIVGGSTFPGEELMLARLLPVLRNAGFAVRLLIAPRHIERIPAVVKELEGTALPVVRRSVIETNPAADIILLDTIGELRSVYAAANLVFIGKSIYERGGQNPLEPAAWGKPIVFGPNMQNFRDITDLLLKEDGAVRVQDENELTDVMLELCRDAQRRTCLGENALKTVQKNQGALNRIMKVIEPALKTVE